MAIIRQKREQHFSVISNDVLNDKRLSFKARGLLVYMLSMKDDWKFYTAELVEHSEKDGIKSIRSALNEIEAAGYLQRIQSRGKHGHFKEQDWKLFDTPTFSPEAPLRHAVERQTDKRQTAKGTLTITNCNNNLNKQILNISSSNEEKQEEDSRKEIDTFIRYFEGTMFIETTPTQKTRLRSLLRAVPSENRKEIVESIVQGIPIKVKDPVSYFAKSLINASQEAKS